MNEFIHIGFPKTASTTLQEHVFSKTPAIENVGRPFDNPDDAQLLNGLALDDDRDYREEDMVARVAAGRENGTPVLVYSDETVVNTPIRRIAAKRLKRGVQKLLGSGGRDTHLAPSWRSQIVEYYGANNERLARDHGLDLAAHKYPL